MSMPNKTAIKGLNDWAKDFVQNAESFESGDVIEGIDGIDYLLQEHVLEDKGVFVEYEQDQTWNSLTSTQTIFLALKDGNGEIVSESKWSEAVIREDELPDMEVPLL